MFQRYLLFLAGDNTLQDCDGIAEGSAIDSEIIQDYKKGNQKHLQLNPNKTSKKVTNHNSPCLKKMLLLKDVFLILQKVIYGKYLLK